MPTATKTAPCGSFDPNGPLYYRNSGHSGIAGFLSVAILVIAGCVLVGLAAGLSLAWSLVYLQRVGTPQVLLAFGAPAIAAYLIVRLLRRHRVRSIRVGLMIAILAAPVLVHSTALFFVLALTGQLSVRNPEWLIRLAVYPGPIWQVVGSCWTKAPWVPLSLTILAGFTLVVLPLSAFRAADYAECDRCRVEMDTKRRWEVPAGNPQRLISEVENGNFEQILDRISRSPESETSWTVSVEQCPTCGQFSLLSVFETRVRRRRGEAITTHKKLIDRLILRPEWATALTDDASAGRPTVSLG